MKNRFPEKPGNSLSSPQALYASDAVSGTIAWMAFVTSIIGAYAKCRKKPGRSFFTQNPDLMVLPVTFQVG